MKIILIIGMLILVCITLIYAVEMIEPNLTIEEKGDYHYIYKQIEYQGRVYADVIYEVPEVWNSTTLKFNKAYSITTTDVIGYETKYKNGDVIGIVYDSGSKIISGRVNLKGNVVSRWSVPIGDRNMEEFGSCRPYEIDKEVCEEIII